MLFHKFDGSIVNEKYKEGYAAGLMQKTSNKEENSTDFQRGFYDAQRDLCGFEEANCC